MGQRGPKPKDKAVKTPLVGVPDPPPDLSKEAKAKWVEVSKLILESGLLSKLDRDALHVYCVAFATWLEAMAHIKIEGAVIRVGIVVKKNPWLDVAAQAEKAIKIGADQFGLSPKARQALSAPEIEKRDAKWAEF